MTESPPRHRPTALSFFLSTVRRFWWVIAVAVVVGCVASVLAYNRAVPQYRSTAQLFVSLPTSDLGPQASYQGGLFTQQRVISYADLVTSPKVLDPVLASTGLDLTRSQLASHVSVEAPENTVLINMSVTLPSAADAQKATQAIAEAFSAFVERIERPEVDSAPPIRIVVSRAAQLPNDPISPQLRLYLVIGLLGGLVVGLACASVLVIRDRTVKSLEETSDDFGLRALANVPADPSLRTGPDADAADSDSGKHRLEAYRQLRAQLRFIDVDTPPRVIMFTSARQADGKTTTAVGFARVQAQAGARVLLIEADLHRPQLCVRYGFPQDGGGLSGFLAEETEDREPAIVEVDGLHVLPAGAAIPFPGDALASRRMASLIAELREQFDYVVIDSPPVLPVADAINLAPLTDVVVVIARYGATGLTEIGETVRRLRSAGVTCQGLVVNRVPSSAAGYGYGYGYGYGFDRAAEPAATSG